MSSSFRRFVYALLWWLQVSLTIGETFDLLVSAQRQRAQEERDLSWPPVTPLIDDQQYCTASRTDRRRRAWGEGHFEQRVDEAFQTHFSTLFWRPPSAVTSSAFRLTGDRRRHGNWKTQHGRRYHWATDYAENQFLLYFVVIKKVHDGQEDCGKQPCWMALRRTNWILTGSSLVCLTM